MNIFEQILSGQKIINDNVAALGDNLNVVNHKIDTLITIFNSIESEPNAPGAEQNEQ